MKISINTPCHERWDAMSPNEQGAFCLACQKNVIDFSRKTTQEIKSFFSRLPDTEKVCGRFDEKQLEELSFDDFFQRFRLWRFAYKAAVICFFVFGMTLFSCTPKEDNRIMGEVAPQENIIKKDTISCPDTATTASIVSGTPTVVKAPAENTKGDVAIAKEEKNYMTGKIKVKK